MSAPVSEFVVHPADHGQRLDRFLLSRIRGLSRTRIQTAIRERVHLSWSASVRPSTPVRAGGVVHLRYRQLNETLLEITLPVLARGNGWLAVNKPAGLVVHPVHRILENSLIRILRRQENDPLLRLVHRLDAETSGVLLVARDSETARSLSKGFFRREIGKHYLAIVDGVIEPSRIRFDRPIGKAEQSEIFDRQAAGTGRPAVTHLRVIRRFGDRTLVRLQPTSGRRHQLRVHLADAGYPILGDLLYAYPESAYLGRIRGKGDPRADGDRARRQMLHSAGLCFQDPATGLVCRVRAPLPTDFREQMR